MFSYFKNFPRDLFYTLLAVIISLLLEYSWPAKGERALCREDTGAI